MVYQDLFDFLFHPGNSLNTYLSLDPVCRKSWEMLVTIIKPIKVTYGEMLSLGDEIPDRIYFLEKGAVKGYKYTSAKINVDYLWEGPSLVGDIKKFVQERESDLFIEVVKNSSLLMLERKALKNCIFGDFETQLILDALTSYSLRFCNQRSHDLTFLNDFQRFQNLYLERSNLDLIFSSIDLASFLRIDLESYNRFCNHSASFFKSGAKGIGRRSAENVKITKIFVDDRLKRQIQLIITQSVN